MGRFKIVCGECQGSRLVDIHNTPIGGRIDWLEDHQRGAFTIISGRERLDNQWGFQCICGNNDLLTAQEKRTFSNPASPKPQEIEDIVKNLTPDSPRFRLVAV